MVARLDVLFRVDDSTDQLKTNYDAGGESTITLAHGTYASLALLCAQIQTKLQVVNASYTCTESAGAVTIAATANFTLTWDHPGLRDWIGFSGSGEAGTNTYTGSNSPGTHVFEHPSDWEVDFQIHTRAWSTHHQRGSSVKTASSRVFFPRFVMSYTDLTSELRTVLSYMSQGQQARWWRDSTVNSAFDWTSQPDGFSDVVLDQDGYDDGWTSDVQLVWSGLPLRFLEVA